MTFIGPAHPGAQCLLSFSLGALYCYSVDVLPAPHNALLLPCGCRLHQPAVSQPFHLNAGDTTYLGPISLLIVWDYLTKCPDTTKRSLSISLDVHHGQSRGGWLLSQRVHCDRLHIRPRRTSVSIKLQSILLGVHPTMCFYCKKWTGFLTCAGCLGSMMVNKSSVPSTTLWWSWLLSAHCATTHRWTSTRSVPHRCILIKD